MKRNWLFLAAAALPCAAMLLFFGVAVHEWWLISTRQIVVIPTPLAGAGSAPEVPAANLVPFIVGSGVLAGMFAYALLRGSRRVLIAAYALIALVAGLAWLARTL